MIALTEDGGVRVEDRGEAAPLRVVCAWCFPNSGREAAARGEVISHGICLRHAAEWRAQLKGEFQAEPALAPLGWAESGVWHE